ncbi:Subtilisin-like protease SBT4.15 [Linum perenne]
MGTSTTMKKWLIFLSILTTMATLFTLSTADTTYLDGRKEYIVYMGDVKKGYSHLAAVDSHHNLLSSILQDEELARKVRIDSYGRSFDGFSAHLLPEEVEELKEKENVVSIFPNKIRKLHTTRSWDFLGIHEDIFRNNHVETDIIVGMFDTGIDINAPSFNDKGLGPPPSKWKGICQTGVNFTSCNNKVIGARAYNIGPKHKDGPVTPGDTVGHGSHTASTVAGASVTGASLYGIGEGTARGGVPSARIAVYKVCSGEQCPDLYLMRAFDDAIADGVDVISASIGGTGGGDYFTDAISIGSFHAMRNGILTSCSAGNSGPTPATIDNFAPWIMTVGASGTDRQFVTPVAVGSGYATLGVSINTFSMEKKYVPLTSAIHAANQSSEDAKLYPGACLSSFLIEEKVKGKIVLCNDVILAESTGGIGLLQSSTTDGLTNSGGFPFVFPTSILTVDRYNSILGYINSTRNPKAVIFKSRSINVSAPFVGSFSSRGPDQYSKTILKPDIVAPGVNILAAFSKHTTITGAPHDNRFSTWNIYSGTSMACPHATAAAVYVKSFHPDWSPAAVKSALMTTATKIIVPDELAEYAYGSGQIDPKRATNPGLVYDMTQENYILYLCSLGYTGTALTSMVGENVTCPSTSKFKNHDAVNYPSIPAATKPWSAVFRRTATNVGAANATYEAVVTLPAGKKGFKIKVVPDALTFKKVNEKKSFRVEVWGPPVGSDDGVLSGSLEWRGKSGHIVRSPIVISGTY